MGLGNTEREITYPDTMVVDTRDGLVENAAGLHEVLTGASESFIESRCESSSMGGDDHVTYVNGQLQGDIARRTSSRSRRFESVQ